MTSVKSLHGSTLPCLLKAMQAGACFIFVAGVGPAGSYLNRQEKIS
jgi:hypothetical protein